VTKPNRITYRFDRQGNKIEETHPAQEVLQPAALHEEVEEPILSNEQKWSFDEPAHNIDATTTLNQYEIDIEKLEKLIRESSLESTHDEERLQQDNGSKKQIEIDHYKQEQPENVEQANLLQEDVNQAKLQEEVKHVKIKQDLASSSLQQPLQSQQGHNKGDRKGRRVDHLKQESYNDTHAERIPANWSHYEEHVYSHAESDYVERADEKQRLYELDQYEEASTDSTRVRSIDEATFLEQANHEELDRKPLPWLNSAVSVISAIVTGICIGYLMLSLVFGVSVWPLSALAKPSEAEQAATVGSNDNMPVPVVEGRDAKEVTSGTAVQLSEASFQYHVLQAGVFTQEKTRDEVLASLELGGFNGHYIKDSSDRYFVYAGLATTATNAAPIQGKIKGIETYRKEMTLQLPSQIAFNGEAEKLDQYFNDSNALISMYADLVAIQLEQTSFSKIGEAAYSAAQTSYNNWLSLANEIEAHWVDSIDKQQAITLKEELMNAQAQLQNYQAEPKSVYLWSIQSSLVKSVLLQKEWYE